MTDQPIRRHRDQVTRVEANRRRVPAALIHVLATAHAMRAASSTAMWQAESCSYRESARRQDMCRVTFDKRMRLACILLPVYSC
jgi:hypothetical protein